uniref:Uncharacterized protein n=1 Tax=Panagrolaimus superbus TaxID=310955 RepID=A0A914XYT9_9BILA
MKNHRRLLNTNPDSYYEEDIRRLYENSLKDSFSNEYYATYIFPECIQMSLTESDCLGSSLSIGSQFLIKFEKCCAIVEIARIDDNSGGNELLRILYLKLIKRETSYPEWDGHMEILKI